MRIKSFKLFESFKSGNSNYETLKDVLQSELFDELDIETIPNHGHSFDEFGGEPRHKFWSYFIIPSDLAPSSLSAPIANALYTCDRNNSDRIAYINVFNISIFFIVLTISLSPIFWHLHCQSYNTLNYKIITYPEMC